MLDLAKKLPSTRIRIFSGIEPGQVKRAMLLAATTEGDDGDRRQRLGTVIFSPAAGEEC